MVDNPKQLLLDALAWAKEHEDQFSMGEWARWFEDGWEHLGSHVGDISEVLEQGATDCGTTLCYAGIIAHLAVEAGEDIAPDRRIDSAALEVICDDNVQMRIKLHDIFTGYYWEKDWNESELGQFNLGGITYPMLEAAVHKFIDEFFL